MSITTKNHDRSAPLIEGVTGVVLAGGKSSRFGKNKALAEINGIPLIERVIHIMGSVFERLIISSNTPDEYSYLQLPIHEDLIKGLGPIGGIYTGLNVIEDEAAFFVACDMPFINQGLIRYIVNVKGDFDAVAPKIDWKMEALHALYKKNCLSVIKEMIDSRSYQTLKLFQKVNVRFVDEEEVRRFDPQLKSFVNVNRPDELTDMMRSEEVNKIA
ncbi:MAG: molybdenum cofactor guanylyltransferase [Deltaproteobacteria bacterium]|nr:molybdenum cofactor guanylyltransferase [Deltaproteobacteria bacterium]